MSLKLLKINLLIVLIIVTSTIIQTGKTQDNSGFEQINMGPGFEASELQFIHKYYNSSLSGSYNEIIRSIENIYGGSIQIQAELSATSLNDFNTNRFVSVAMLFNDRTNSTDNEITLLKTFLNQGKGLFYLTKPGNASKSAQYFVNELFGTPVIKFTDYQINGSIYDTSLPYIIASDFNSPRTPATENLTKLLLPNTVGMEINFTAAEETNMTIKDIYPIIYDDKNTILSVAIELESYGRIIFSGSSELLSNKVILHEEEYRNFVTIDNKDFGLSAFGWLGRSTGYFNKYSHTLNVMPLQAIKRDFKISASILIKDNNNNSVKDAEIKVEIEIFNRIVDSSYMSNYNQNGSISEDTFFGELSAKNAKEGTYNEIRVSVLKRGFVYQSFLIGRVYIIKNISGNSLPNLTIIAVMASVIIIFLISFSLIWMKFSKMSAEV